MVTRQPEHGPTHLGRVSGVEDTEDAENRAGEGPCGDVAAYVLGVLDPAQREIFARHLAGCEGCQGDAADFGVFAPVLRQSVSSLGPPRPCRVARDVLLVAAGIVVAVAAVLSVVGSLATHTDDPVELGSLLRAEGVSAGAPFVLFRHV